MAARDRRSRILPFLLGAGMLAAEAPDQEHLDAFLRLLSTRVVTATRMSEPLRLAPASVVVVTGAQIRSRGYRSLLDLLQDLPGFKVERGTHEHYYTYSSVRGLPGVDKFLVLLDGHRITGPTNEPLPIFENVPVHTAERVEVAYGPAAAVYGADAVAAVVNIITREGTDASSAAVQGGDHGLGLAQWDLVARGGKWTFRFGGQAFVDGQPPLERWYPDYRDFQAQRSGSFPTAFAGTLHPQGYDPEPAHPLWAQAFHAALEAEGFRLAWFRNSSRFPSSDKNTPDNAIYNADLFIGHNLDVISLDHESELGPVHLGVHLSDAEYGLDPRSNYRDVFGYFDRAYKYARSSAQRAEVQGDWEPAAAWRFSAGLGSEHFDALPWSADLAAPVDDRREPSGTLLGAPIPARFYALRYRNDSAFGQVRWRPTEALALTAGTRLDQNSRYGRSVNPRLGLTWSPRPATSVKLLYGSAFLAPSPYEAYLHFGAFYTADQGQTYQADFWRLPNPDLKPQTSRTLELSLRQGLAGNLDLGLDLYRIDVRNLFVVVPDGLVADRYHGTFEGWPVKTIVVVENQGRQVNRGGTLSLRTAWWAGAWEGHVQASVSRTEGWVDLRGDGTHREIGQLAPWSGQAAVEAMCGPWTLAPRLVWVGAQRTTEADPSGRRYRLPGYPLLTFRTQREWESAKGSLALYLEIRNVLDVRYRNLNLGARPGGGPEFFGVPQDPRRWSVGLRWSR